MTPPGLTCCECANPLAPNLARRTLDGFRHARRCPRLCTVDGCDRKHLARGYCRRHYSEAVEMKTLRPAHDPAERIDDLRWMADTGECLEGAARRLGISERAVSLFLTRHGERELLKTLTRRNPRDHNAAVNVALAGVA